jgi:hypothetical protein
VVIEARRPTCWSSRSAARSAALPVRIDQCAVNPPLEAIAPGHEIACWVDVKTGRRAAEAGAIRPVGRPDRLGREGY